MTTKTKESTKRQSVSMSPFLIDELNKYKQKYMDENDSTSSLINKCLTLGLIMSPYILEQNQLFYVSPEMIEEMEKLDPAVRKIFKLIDYSELFAKYFKAN